MTTNDFCCVIEKIRWHTVIKIYHELLQTFRRVRTNDLYSDEHDRTCVHVNNNNYYGTYVLCHVVSNDNNTFRKFARACVRASARPRPRMQRR